MINPKYKKIYEEFITKYEEINPNPWHEINKEELNRIYEDLTNKIDVNDEYNFKYFMDYIIKRLSGLSDAHTRYLRADVIPFIFKIVDNTVLVSYPEDLKGYELTSISDIPINKIIDELDDVITYGTLGKKTYGIENSLPNRIKMFGLPSLRNKDEMIYTFKNEEGHTLNKKITKTEKYDKLPNYSKSLFENNAKYKVVENTLIYNHSSVQLRFENTIEESIKQLEEENLDNINAIIIDIRGNTGGHSKLNNPLINFLKKHQDKKLICLTDYRVFSGGRFALRDLIDLGAITIGGEISTPINCFGNNVFCNIDNHEFTVSRSYLDPCRHIQANTKEEYDERITEELRVPIIFKPDIEIKQTIEDYLNDVDTVLEYALKYSKQNRKVKGKN